MQTSLSEAAVTKTHTHSTANRLDTPILLAASQQVVLLVPHGQVHRQVETCHHPLMDQMMVDMLLVRRNNRVYLRNGDDRNNHVR